MRHNGFGASTDPLLDPLDTIECRDAILAPDGEEPGWPAADVVIGNPPFLGDRVIRDGLGHAYTEHLRLTYRGAAASSADLVCYWFHKAGKRVAAGQLARAGLVAINSIQGGNCRHVLDRIVSDCAIFDAWPDEPRIIDGAAVRVSLVCFGAAGAGLPVSQNGAAADHVYADLSEGGIDLTRVTRLDRNRAVAFLGVYKNGPFDILDDLAREWLCLPANPNSRRNSDVLKPRFNGMDLTRRPAGNWIVDFGEDMGEVAAALYEAPFAHVVERVKPVRLNRRRERPEVLVATR